MSQYNTGTANVTNGSSVITGLSTVWLANISAGDVFTVANSGVMYIVASVSSDTGLRLSAPYTGVTLTNAYYTIVRDFTPRLQLPYPSHGDQDTASIVKDALLKLDNAVRKLPIAWSTPTFASPWADYGLGWDARYAKDDSGTVFIKGLVKNGSNTTNTTIFTLPVGFRPLTYIMIAQVTSAGAGRVDIYPNGNVQFIGGDPHTGSATAFLAISASFKAEQ